MFDMKTSAHGRNELELREGLRLQAYRDQRGIWTIGYGHTSMAGPPHVDAAMRITRSQADAIFQRDLTMWEEVVNSHVHQQPTQSEFDAMVSLAHNIGEPGFAGSAVLHYFNLGRIQHAADAFMNWIRPPSLIARREAERKQFLSP